MLPLAAWTRLLGINRKNRIGFCRVENILALVADDLADWLPGKCLKCCVGKPVLQRRGIFHRDRFGNVLDDGVQELAGFIQMLALLGGFRDIAVLRDPAAASQPVQTDIDEPSVRQFPNCADRALSGEVCSRTAALVKNGQAAAIAQFPQFLKACANFQLVRADAIKIEILRVECFDRAVGAKYHKAVRQFIECAQEPRSVCSRSLGIDLQLLYIAQGPEPATCRQQCDKCGERYSPWIGQVQKPGCRC